MKTLKLSSNSDDLKVAANMIRSEKLVVFPTETVYGLGANAFSDSAVTRVFEAKGRPQDNPLIVHLSDAEQIQEVADFSENSVSDVVKRLLDAFSPGPLTLVLPKSPKISNRVSAGLPSVAIRIPSHPVAQEFLRLCGVPVAAPSANLSGRPSPTRFNMAWHDLEGRVDAIIDGGECSVGLESTVVRVTKECIFLLRPGSVTAEMLKDVSGLPIVQPKPAGKTESPGVRYAHYQPNAEVYLADKISVETIKKHFDLLIPSHA